MLRYYRKTDYDDIVPYSQFIIHGYTPIRSNIKYEKLRNYIHRDKKYFAYT